MDTARQHDPTMRIASASFESIAAGRGFVTPAQAEECRALHQKLVDMGLPSTIEEVFFKKGYLTQQQVSAIDSVRGKGTADAIPGYVLIEKIAEGGMGAVYKAKQTSMDRVVALKVLLAQLADEKEGRERFVREARAVAKLSHPNVVAGIDAGEAHGIYYFVMEYLDGESMDKTLRRRGRLPWSEAAAIVRQMALALDHAHQHGIVHRDIKPGNIMLLPDGTAKLADLGLARVTSLGDAALTQTGMIVGSPAYLSPEQAMGDRDLDTRSDIFSLGLTFFELVAGERAYAGDNPISILSALLTRDVPVEKLAATDVPEDVTAVIAKMVHREPGRRYQTPKTLLDDLDAILSGRRTTPPIAAAVQSRGHGYEKPADVSNLHTSRMERPSARRQATKPLAPWALGGGAVAVVALVVLVMAFRPGGGQQEVGPPRTAAERSAQTFEAKVSLVAAISAARKAARDGTVYHVELERDKYSIDLAEGDRSVNVIVDATHGGVVERIDEDEDHSAEVEACKIELAAAVQAALSKAPGRAYEAEILLLPGRTVVEVKVMRDHKPVTVHVDGVTGEAKAFDNVAG